MSADLFDWTENEDVVVRTQMGIAIFENVRGEICVRQEGMFHPDEDQWITFGRDNAAAIARRILEVARVDLQSPDRVALRAPKDRTAAERQRRRRDKHSDVTPAVTTGDRDSTVTGRDGHALKAVANG